MNVHDGERGCRFCRLLLRLLLLLWLLWLIRSLIRLCRVARRHPRRGAHDVPPWAYRQPDPLIYCQTFLQAQGLGVTWDNPDIHLELSAQPGVPVDSHSLDPNTEYVVVARIWNGSTTAPAVDLPVRASYLEFGIGTIRHDIGQTTVDLPVKGAAGTPAIARIPWRTPAAAGHYCLQVELVWADDAEPANNLGQHNTDVRPLNSPRATFEFPLRNDGPRPRLLRLEVDGYRLPGRRPCPPRDHDPERERREALTRHARQSGRSPKAGRSRSSRGRSSSSRAPPRTSPWSSPRPTASRAARP